MDNGIDKPEIGDQSQNHDSEPQEAQGKQEAQEDAIYIDEAEGDHKKPTMSPEQLRAAWRKEKEKRQEKQRQIDADREEKERLKREIDELKSKVGEISRGSVPTLENCNYDEELFSQKVREYYSGQQSSQAQPSQDSQPAQQNNSYQVSDEAQYYLFQKEQEIMQSMPGYPEAKKGVEEHLLKLGIEDSQAVFGYLSDVARFKKADIAKTIVAIDKKPEILQELIDAGDNQILVAEIVAEAASKVKTRTKKAVDSEPEPSLHNKGPIDATAAQVEKLRDRWAKSGKASDYAAYKAAKQKLSKGD